MIPAIRSEFRKFFSTRLWWGLLIPVILGSGVFAWLSAFFFAGTEVGPGVTLPGLDDPEMVSSTYSAGLQISQVLLLAVGVLMIGTEYRHKTITSTFLAIPKRAKVMAAKVISLLALGAFYGVVGTLTSFGVGAAIIASKGYDILPDGALRTLVMSLLVLGLWALIGLGIGILIPSQVAALFVAVGFAWIVEPLLNLLFANQDWGKSIAPYFPSSATEGMVGAVSSPGTTTLVWWAAALVLLAYAAVMTGLGTWRTLRSDIS
ncbi:MAG: ABC transporter permease subunit [Micrococcales bacterium]|nr:ABC transporter permease subunit [Micrococcales bacterium]